MFHCIVPGIVCITTCTAVLIVFMRAQEKGYFFYIILKNVSKYDEYFDLICVDLS